MQSGIRVKVLFVCLGNICRSPTAEGVFRDMVLREKLQDQIYIDSAGTGDYHIGQPPDKRAVLHAGLRGIDISELRARQVEAHDFQLFDYILAMDGENLLHLQSLAPAPLSATLKLFLEYHPKPELREVPDPYWSGAEGFEQVLDMIQEAASNLLIEIKEKYFAR